MSDRDAIARRAREHDGWIPAALPLECICGASVSWYFNGVGESRYRCDSCVAESTRRTVALLVAERDRALAEVEGKLKTYEEPAEIFQIHGEIRRMRKRLKKGGE